MTFDRTQLPGYAHLPGQLIPVNPYIFKDTVHTISLFQTNMEALEVLCNNWFNSLPGMKTKFKPLVPLVIVDFQSCENVCFTKLNGEEANFNIDQLNFQILVQDSEGKNYRFAPYRFVSNSSLIPFGREIYGIPSTQGLIRIPTSITEVYSCRTNAIRNFSTTSKDRNWEIAKIKGFANGRTRPKKHPNAHDKIFDFIKGPLKSMKLPASTLKLIATSPGGYWLNLKQLRMPFDPNKAFYQAVIYFENGVVAKGFEPITAPLELSFPVQCDMYPVCENLGLNVAPKKGEKARSKVTGHEGVNTRHIPALVSYKLHSDNFMASSGILHETRLNPYPDDYKAPEEGIGDTFSKFFSGIYS